MPSTEHDAVVALLRDQRPLVPPPLEQARTDMEATTAFLAVPGDVAFSHDELGGVPAEQVTPAEADTTRTVLYLHGGAYTLGSVGTHRSLCARIAVAAGCPVMSVDYRLAPEHPHPAALDDAQAALAALLDRVGDPARVVVAGDSAGGGLAAALLVAQRDAGDPLPAGAVLLSPWTDLTLTAPSITARADADPMLTAPTLALSAARYAGDQLRSPLVSPLFADLAGLPPMLVIVGTAEILLDDATSFAERASASGVAVDLEVGEDLIHVYPVLAGVPEADAAIERIGVWVRARQSA